MRILPHSWCYSNSYPAPKQGEVTGYSLRPLYCYLAHLHNDLCGRWDSLSSYTHEIPYLADLLPGATEGTASTGYTVFPENTVSFLDRFESLFDWGALTHPMQHG